LHFTVGYFAAADAGSLASGFATLLLIRQGIPVHRSRVTVFSVCALLTTLSLVVAVIPTGPLLLVLLLVLAFAMLGLFPQYYSFSQELTTRHQGKITGALGCITWMSVAAMQGTVGAWIKETHDYPLAVSLAGLLPLAGLAAMLTLWTPRSRRRFAATDEIAIIAGAAEPQTAVAPLRENLHG
jgi:ACS family hexuronate transporter-like MFS transporter